jgi:hypothetical protein
MTLNLESRGVPLFEWEGPGKIVFDLNGGQTTPGVCMPRNTYWRRQVFWCLFRRTYMGGYTVDVAIWDSTDWGEK